LCELDATAKVAKLPTLKGGLWHPYRRAWATTRKHLPVADVAQAGDWRRNDAVAVLHPSGQ